MKIKLIFASCIFAYLAAGACYADVADDMQKHIAKCDKESEALVDVKWDILQENNKQLPLEAKASMLELEKRRCKAIRSMTMTRLMIAIGEKDGRDPGAVEELRKIYLKDLEVLAAILLKTGEINQP